MKTKRHSSSIKNRRLLSRLRPYAIWLYRSIWFSPALLTIVLLLLCSLKINGSSIGFYNIFLNGKELDSSLIANSPRSTRADEWVVVSPMTLAQYNNNRRAVNEDIGNGQNMDILLDTPSQSFWQIFKPHNLMFYLLPFDFAFAFKWWFMGYLLILSVYFLVLRFLPGKRLIAGLIALSAFFSPFIQWWYQFITIAPIYYGIFIYLTATKIYTVRSKKQLLLLTALLAYLLTAFVFVFYPAFMVSVVLVIAPLTLLTIGRQLISRRTLLLLASGAVALILVGFLYVAETAQIKAISNSDYPGSRSVQSGGYNPIHLLASGFSPVFQSGGRASHYNIPEAAANNQSESSNFILLLPYLALPLLAVYTASRKKKVADSTTRRDVRLAAATALIAFGLLLWLLVPNLGLLGKILLLTQVPHQRLLIAFGILNIFSIILFIKHWDMVAIKKKWLLIYAAGVTAISLFVGWYIHTRFPLFAGVWLSLALSLVIPVIVALFLFKRYLLATLVFFAFSFASTFAVHPVYRGTDILSNNPIISEIKRIESHAPGVWAIEDVTIENIALTAGAKSLTGVYAYPQLDYWGKLAPEKTDKSIYNRYAHVTINFDRKEEVSQTEFTLVSTDHFAINTEACSEFTSKAQLKYIVTSNPITGSSANCLKEISRVQTGIRLFTIYTIKY